MKTRNLLLAVLCFAIVAFGAAQLYAAVTESSTNVPLAIPDASSVNTAETAPHQSMARTGRDLRSGVGTAASAMATRTASASHRAIAGTRGVQRTERENDMLGPSADGAPIFPNGAAPGRHCDRSAREQAG